MRRDALRGFFSDGYCLVDFVVVVLDLALLAVEPLVRPLLGCSARRSCATTDVVKAFRLVRLVRLLKAGRILQRFKREAVRVPHYFEVRLDGGFVLPKVPLAAVSPPRRLPVTAIAMRWMHWPSGRSPSQLKMSRT